jgi:putative ATPase
MTLTVNFDRVHEMPDALKPIDARSGVSVTGGPLPRPLADRMRPRTLAEFVGQQHLVGIGRPLRHAIESGRAHSMVLWGPPGSGKTTLARLIAGRCQAQLLAVSAVLAGVKDIRAAVENARACRERTGADTILFVDEAHRFNKAQQDAFLPYVEQGEVVFIGATTENPSFELTSALLSRARVYVLKVLEVRDIRAVIDRALVDTERGVAAAGIGLSAELRDQLATAADGDVRRALNLLEIVVELAQGAEGSGEVTRDLLLRVLEGGSIRRFDKGGDLFYEQISALHKSVRGSAPDASLYWLARMLDAGCDPLYVARRLVRIAAEDIGSADPRALQITLNAWDAQARLGSPEGELALAEAVVYLACAPKSNAVYLAFQGALRDAKASGSLSVPLRLRNAATRLMRDLNYGGGYRYAHDEPEAYAAGENYFPEELGARRYYFPTDRGLELRIGEKLARLRARDAKAGSKRER